MGLESRDWYREETSGRKGRRRRRARAFAVLLTVLVAAAAISPTVSDRLGYTVPFGLSDHFRKSDRGASVGIRLLPGTPAITLGRNSLYPRDDPWRAWLADEATCPGGERTDAPPEAQLRTMACLMNYARRHEALAELRLSSQLMNASYLKAGDIASCHEFAHTACGKEFSAAARAEGHRGAFGENLYIAEGPLTAPRVALDGWLNSPGHRENLFRPQWRTAGIALLRDVDAGPVDGGTVWVMHFGD
ncbi:MAG: CAP domain-containing protein [Gaiella sp.]